MLMEIHFSVRLRAVTRTRTFLTAVLLVAAAAGCAWCERGERNGAGADVRRFLPKNAELAVVVPEIGVLGDRIQQLQRLKLASFVVANSSGCSQR